MFLVDDVTVTAEWYRDVLGFEIGEYFSDDHSHDEDGNDIEGSGTEVQFVIIERDGHRIMLGKTTRPGHGRASNLAFKTFSSDLYLWCDDVQPIFQHAQSKGADVLQEPETQFYGLREFRIKDVDGRVLTFGSPATG